jgi:hypothetical protein
LHHLAGQRLDVVLGLVDDGQPLLQLGQAFLGGAVCSVMVWPMRPVMASRRWPMDWLSSAWRAPNTSAIAPMRPCISACA